MDKKLAIIGIFVEEPAAIETVNGLLHNYAQYIQGRLGLPYPERGVNVIAVVIDAPADEISSLAGKLGNIGGISAKTLQSKI